MICELVRESGSRTSSCGSVGGVLPSLERRTERGVWKGSGLLWNGGLAKNWLEKQLAGPCAPALDVGPCARTVDDFDVGATLWLVLS